MRKTIHRHRNLGWICFGVLVAILGCRQNGPAKNKSNVISLEIPIKAYVKLKLGLNGSKESRFYFPTLEAYNTVGDLVYASHDVKQNEVLLRGLPESILTLKPLSLAIPLSTIAAEYPKLAEKADGLTHQSRATILAVDLQDCHACSIQEQTLNDLDIENRAPKMGLNYISIKILK